MAWNISFTHSKFLQSFLSPQGLVVSRLLSSQIRIKTLKMSAASGGTREKLKERVLTTLKRQFGEEENFDPMVVPAKPEFGDYQCNAAMPLAKRLKMKPRDIAEKLMASLEVDDMIVSMDISGPGFINLKLSEDYLKKELLTKLGNSQRAGVATTNQPQRIVVDFSSPNIAKEMHVGHLRSSIIGDSISRILEFLGHDVLRLNHVGDWGTQFGMLINYLKEQAGDGVSGSKDVNSFSVGDLMAFYRAAKKKFDEDPAFKESSRNEVVKLQSGDESSIAAWNSICDLSRQEFQKIYELLNITITERGESFYNPYLAPLVAELEQKGVLVESQGSKCVFLTGDKFLNTDGSPLPLIVQKSDGGFLYATTDLAAVSHRSRVEKADRVLYVTDAGQAQHFQMVFEAARASGLVGPNTELVHVPFGLVLGEDGKKIKTRSGESVKLKELLDEAVRIASLDMRQRAAAKAGNAPEAGAPSPQAPDANTGTADLNVTLEELTEEERAVASVVGLGAVKYADLSMNRMSDYRFSFKKMLSLTGNTAPYMLYAYVRILGIQRKAAAAVAKSLLEEQQRLGQSSEGREGSEGVVVVAEGVGGDLGAESGDSMFAEGVVRALGHGDLVLEAPEELQLAKQLLKLEEVLVDVSRDLCPNQLCEYLFELSQKFNSFYERCPVIKADNAKQQRSRAALCLVTADTLRIALGLLGINTVEKL